MFRLTSAVAVSRLPVMVALVGVLFGGWFLLDRSEAQARDTIRKHHLEDIERSLFFARGQHGTYPPYDQPTWCGLLNDPANEDVRAQVEEVLRAQNEKYGNEAKPFPRDPLRLVDGDSEADYFYWKRSPALFELYAILEADPNGERTTQACLSTPGRSFDYGLSSGLREDRTTLQP